MDLSRRSSRPSGQPGWGRWAFLVSAPLARHLSVHPHKVDGAEEQLVAQRRLRPGTKGPRGSCLGNAGGRTVRGAWLDGRIVRSANEAEPRVSAVPGRTLGPSSFPAGQRLARIPLAASDWQTCPRLRTAETATEHGHFVRATRRRKPPVLSNNLLFSVDHQDSPASCPM